MAKGQEVAVPGSFGDKSAAMPAHVRTNLPARGNENATGSALATPQLKLLQAISPECRSVEGAKPGLLFNNVTRELYEAVYVMNLHLDVMFTVWKDRKKGGGKFGEFATESEAQTHLATLNGDPDDYIVQETHKHYLLLLDENGAVKGPAVVYMKATQLTPSRAWNTGIQLENRDADGNPLDRFATVWMLSSETVDNNSGDAYENFTIECAGWPSSELFEAAQANYESLTGNRAAPAEQTEEAA